jgi:putative membrane protein
MMGYYGGFGVLGGLGMGIGMILWVALIAVVIWAAISFFSPGAKGDSRTDESPIEILKRRYARGEISQAEFEQARANLS